MALQGASEDARTREHRLSSPAPDVRPRAYSVSASRQNVPKFFGGAPQYSMWQNKILSHPSTFSCREADPMLVCNNESCPASCNSDTQPAKMTMRHALGSYRSTELFSLVWPARPCRQGHRVATGKSLILGLSQEGLPNKICGLPNLRTSACKGGKTHGYGPVALTMPGTCLRASMSTIPRLSH